MSRTRLLIVNTILTQGHPLITCLHFSASLFFFLLPFQALSQNEKIHTCIEGKDKVELCSVQVVDPDGRKRVYRYEIKRATPGAPTLLNLPGGPGSTTIGQISQFVTRYDLPKDYGVIAIDPRGAGVNNYGPDPKGKIYSQERIVQDIVAVLDAERPSKYMIYGYSHGSVLATELAAEVTKEGSKHPKPELVLIGGVLAKALKDPEDYRANYNLIFNRVTNSLSEFEKGIFKERMIRLRDQHLNGSDRLLGQVISAMLLYATPVDYGGNVNVENWVKKMATADTSEHDIQMTFSFIKTNVVPTAEAVYKKLGVPHSMSTVITCQELNVKFGGVDFDIDRLQMVSAPSPSCREQGYQLTKPFEAKNFQIRQASIVYVQGSLDPATPSAGAKEHYNEQKQSAKIYIEMQGFAHTDLKGLKECPGFWEALAQGLPAVKTNVENCQLLIPFIKILGYQEKAEISPVKSTAGPTGVQ